MTWECALCQSSHADSVEALEVLDDARRVYLNVCQPCYRGVSSRCACCTLVLNTPQHGNGSGGWICYECVDHHADCAECQAFVNSDNIRELPSGDRVCQTCYQQHYGSCSRCGETRTRDALDGGMCSRCLRGRVIRDHGYKPTPKFHGSGPLFYGVELEVECGDTDPTDAAHEVVNNLGDGLVYAKHDGSLNSGFEVVSHPFSDDWFEREGQAKWSKLLKYLKRAGCRSYDTQTCGMHVHVSRAALDAKQLLRLQRLAHNNPDLIHQISRRRRENLIRWANPRDTNIGEQLALARGTQSDKGQRYAAINVTRHTVEIRIFRGTCEEDGFFGNLEAVRSLVAFCAKPLGLFPKASDYLNYVKDNASKYPNLVSTVLKTALA